VVNYVFGKEIISFLSDSTFGIYQKPDLDWNMETSNLRKMEIIPPMKRKIEQLFPLIIH
jgi:hypothetical protein